MRLQAARRCHLLRAFCFSILQQCLSEVVCLRHFISPCHHAAAAIRVMKLMLGAKSFLPGTATCRKDCVLRPCGPKHFELLGLLRSQYTASPLQPRAHTHGSRMGNPNADRTSRNPKLFTSPYILCPVGVTVTNGAIQEAKLLEAIEFFISKNSYCSAEVSICSLWVLDTIDPIFKPAFGSPTPDSDSGAKPSIIGQLEHKVARDQQPRKRCRHAEGSARWKRHIDDGYPVAGTWNLISPLATTGVPLNEVAVVLFSALCRGLPTSGRRRVWNFGPTVSDAISIVAGWRMRPPSPVGGKRWYVVRTAKDCSSRWGIP